MIKRFIALTLSLTLSVFANATSSSPDKQAFLRIFATSGVAEAAIDLEINGKPLSPLIKNFEKLGDFRVASFSGIRDIASENEIFAESEYAMPLLFAARIVRVTLENGHPVAHIVSISERKNGAPVGVKLKKSSLLLAESLRRGDSVTLLCDGLDFNDDFLMDGCELPGSFHSTIVDRNELRELFIQSCNSTDSVSVSESFLIFLRESPDAEESLESIVPQLLEDDRFQVSGIGSQGRSGIVFDDKRYKAFRSNNPGAFGLDDPDGSKEEFCENLI